MRAILATVGAAIMLFADPVAIRPRPRHAAFTAVLAVTLVGCGAVASSQAQPIAQATMPTTAAATGPVAVLSPSPTVPAATTAVCQLDRELLDWAAVPAEAGRCDVTVFNPPMSFKPEPGWQWAGSESRWVLSRDHGYFSVYRYGGAVVPAYCADPPPMITTPSADQIVTWLQTVPGLSVEAVRRAVGQYPAWQVDLATGVVASCSGLAEKHGLVSLWTIDSPHEGLPVPDVEILDDSARMRAYFVELPKEILVITVKILADFAPTTDDADFRAKADAIFTTLEIDQ